MGKAMLEQVDLKVTVAVDESVLQQFFDLKYNHIHYDSAKQLLVVIAFV